MNHNVHNESTFSQSLRKRKYDYETTFAFLVSTKLQSSNFSRKWIHVSSNNGLLKLYNVFLK